MGTKAKPATLALLEAGLLVGGVSLLVAFAVVRSSQAEQRDLGLAAFQESLHATDSPAEAEDSELGDELSSPDQTLWSEKRVKAYEQSLKLVQDVPLAVLSIDRLNIEVPVYNGADDLNMDRGAGRIKGTAAVSAPGNLGIAAHRDGFFRALKDTAKGDLIQLRTPEALVTYRVTDIVIVDPSDVSVLAQTEDRTLTLVTCYPFYFVGHAPKRYIVKASAEQFLAIN